MFYAVSELTTPKVHIMLEQAGKNSISISSVTTWAGTPTRGGHRRPADMCPQGRRAGWPTHTAAHRCCCPPPPAHHRYITFSVITLLTTSPPPLLHITTSSSNYKANLYINI